MLTVKEIKNKLKEVIDPELGVNIVDLGLVYDIKLGKGNVRISMTLTTPGCPMASGFVHEVERKIKGTKGVKKVFVDLTFDPPWTPSRINKKAKAKLGWRT